jgi:hypothetical protein
VNGIALIVAERRRQITDEGFDADHDDKHTLGDLSLAATAYARIGSATIRGASADEFPVDMMMAEGEWPSEWEEYWRPSDDPIRNLVKAGALIAAEIDRLLRAKGQTS